MKTTELMRFDLIDYNDSVAKIDCIHNNKFIIAIAPFDENCKYVEVKEDEIKRIPLTNKMLEQNGWIQFTSDTDDKKFMYFKHKDVIPDIIFPKDNGDYLFCLFKIRYVHEFQHILQLLGCEDLANNFKIKEICG